MPLYEYKCDSCGDVFELIQRFSDTPLTIHETCGGPVHRLISRSALQFKGSGFYITDYAKSGAPSSKEASNNEGSKSEGSKSEGSKSEGSKSEGEPSGKPAPAEGGAKTESTPSSKPAAGKSESTSKPAAPSSTDK